jgi:hypothetical protein
MNIILFLKSLFAEPTFEVGERVNLVRRGSIEQTDGYVVAQTSQGVLVEWPRCGLRFMPASELAVIV